MENREIAEILFNMAELLAMRDVPFKPRAYEKAAEIIEILPEDVAVIYKKGGIKALEKIEGVGRGIAEKIEEYLKTGRVHEYEELRKKMPVKLGELRRVDGLGPKGIKVLYEQLGVKSIADLKRAVEAGKIRKLAHFGARSEEKILKSISFLEGSSGRFPIGFALPIARRITREIQKLGGIECIEYAGSLRRWQETVGDIDLLVSAEKPKIIMDFFVHMPDVHTVVAHGETKSAVRLKSGVDVDLRVVSKKSYGAALQYFTGNKDHNVMLRKIAIKKGLKLNEYGLFFFFMQLAGAT